MARVLFESRLRQGAGFRGSNDSSSKNPEISIDVTRGLVANNHHSAKMGSYHGYVRTLCASVRHSGMVRERVTEGGERPWHAGRALMEFLPKRFASPSHLLLPSATASVYDGWV